MNGAETRLPSVRFDEEGHEPRRRNIMTKLFLLAGAAALVGAAPAIAKPGGSHGHATVKTAHVTKVKTTNVKTTKIKATKLDRDADGIPDADEALARKYGGALCPPGLWKKTPSCVPPGQAKRLFRVGQRVPLRYKYITPYSSIPGVLVDQYDLNPNYRYIYRNNVIYVIDPTTNLITRIINAVL
jgi:hypothetical protein